ncbi:MAG: DNA recombination protein RmuC, partial [Acidisphaera sp.]|nr:DNA recombination protein RmuC [Acidisphaera sp.]
MPIEVFAGVAAAAALLSVLIVWLQGRQLQRLRLLAEQALAGQRAEAETTRSRLAETERALAAALRQDVAGSLGDLRTALVQGTGELNTRLAEEQGKLRQALAEGNEKSGAGIARQFDATRTLLEAKLREMREGNEGKLAEIQKTVNEQLHQAVEKQMNESFSRVIDQFTAVQKAMGDVQAVTAQIGDIKRLFSNVKTRGGWGEAQVRAMLDDVFPPGSYETNRRLREGSDEMVEFAVIMPMRGEQKVFLPVDAKFPMEDYERLLTAAEVGDAEAERQARRGLDRAIREQARKIQSKYINPPVTVEFAVMYLPTDGLYAEVARIPGMIDEIGRTCRVLILGPSLFPALLRTIHLGHITLTLEQKADQIGKLLGATRMEMLKMDEVLEKLGKQAGTFSTTIEKARQRTRVVRSKLREAEAVEVEAAEQLLELEGLG